MPRLRRVARLCSRTVSSTAYRFRHGSTLCSPTEEKILCRSPYFGAVTYRSSAPGYPMERGDSQEGGNRRCLPSCAPARRQRRFPRFASAPLPMSISSRLTNTRKKGILILLAGMAELADAPDLGSGVLDVQVQVLLPAPAKNAVESLHSVFLLPIFTWTACSVPSAQSAPWLRWRAGACPHRSDLPHRMRQP